MGEGVVFVAGGRVVSVTAAGGFGIYPFLRLFFLARLLCEAEDGDVAAAFAAASRRVSRLLRSHELRELPSPSASRGSIFSFTFPLAPLAIDSVLG